MRKSDLDNEPSCIFSMPLCGINNIDVEQLINGLFNGPGLAEDMVKKNCRHRYFHAICSLYELFMLIGWQLDRHSNKNVFIE